MLASTSIQLKDLPDSSREKTWESISSSISFVLSIINAEVVSEKAPRPNKGA